MNIDNYVKWTKKDFIGLSIIPLELFMGFIIGKVPFIANNSTLGLFVAVSIFSFGFLTMVFLFKDYLVSQWKFYKNKIWLKLLINILLVIGAFLLLQITRAVIKNLSINDTNVTTYQSILMMFIASIPAFVAPFAEELTFRYLLFLKLPNGFFKVIMFFISSILFGLIHINNFNGNLIQTIPYMIIGGYFALISYFFKNIWGSIITHWIFNSVNSVFPVLFLLVSKLFNLM
jgi:CAAX amino terminal protease family.